MCNTLISQCEFSGYHSRRGRVNLFFQKNKNIFVFTFGFFMHYARIVSEGFAMSYKNLKLKLWSKEGLAPRLYIDTAFIDYRHGMGEANGSWIKEGENGEARFGYKSAMNAEGRAMALQMVAQYLTGKEAKECRAAFPDVGISFAELMDRIAQCATAKGNFSYIQYEKKFCS